MATLIPGKIYPLSIFSSFQAISQDIICFGITNGAPSISAQLKGTVAPAKLATYDADGDNGMYHVLPSGANCMIIDTVGMPPWPAAVYYMTGAYQQWLQTVNSAVHPFAMTFSISGAPETTYAYVGRTKLSNPAAYARAKIPKETTATMRYWSSPAIANIDSVVNDPTIAYDVRFLNDSSWYTPEYISAYSAAIAKAGAGSAASSLEVPAILQPVVAAVSTQSAATTPTNAVTVAPGGVTTVPAVSTVVPIGTTTTTVVTPPAAVADVAPGISYSSNIGISGSWMIAFMLFIVLALVGGGVFAYKRGMFDTYLPARA